MKGGMPDRRGRLSAALTDVRAKAVERPCRRHALLPPRLILASATNISIIYRSTASLPPSVAERVTCLAMPIRKQITTHNQSRHLRRNLPPTGRCAASRGVNSTFRRGLTGQRTRRTTNERPAPERSADVDHSPLSPLETRQSSISPSKGHRRKKAEAVRNAALELGNALSWNWPMCADISFPQAQAKADFSPP